MLTKVFQLEATITNLILLEIGNTCAGSCLETAKISQVILLVEREGVWTAGNNYHLLKEMDYHMCKRIEILTGKDQKCAERYGTVKLQFVSCFCYNKTKCIDIIP